MLVRMEIKQGYSLLVQYAQLSVLKYENCTGAQHLPLHSWASSNTTQLHFLDPAIL